MVHNLLRVAFFVASLFLASSDADAANRYAVCSTACTWDGASTAMWSAATGGVTGASVPGTADTVILDAATCVGGTTCTITVNTNVAVIAILQDFCTASTTGCILDFSVNNNNVTLTGGSGLSSGGTGTREIRFGNGTWTFNNSASCNFNAVGLTVSAASSTLVFNSASAFSPAQAFNTGGKIYGTVTFNSRTNGNTVILGQSATIGTLNVNGPMWFDIGAGTTQAITNLNVVGVANQPVVFGYSNPQNSVITLTVTNAPTINYAVMRAVKFTNAATATNSLDGGANANVTIIPPASGRSACIGC